MERTMSDIITLVRKAIEESYHVYISFYGEIIVESSICNDKITIRPIFSFDGCTDDSSHIVITKNGKFYIDANDREKLEFQLLKEDIKEYEKKNANEDLDNFFNTNKEILSL